MRQEQGEKERLMHDQEQWGSERQRYKREIEVRKNKQYSSVQYQCTVDEIQTNRKKCANQTNGARTERYRSI